MSGWQTHRGNWRQAKHGSPGDMRKIHKTVNMKNHHHKRIFFCCRRRRRRWLPFSQTNHIYLQVCVCTTVCCWRCRRCFAFCAVHHHHYIFYNHKSSKLFIPRLKMLFSLWLVGCGCVHQFFFSFCSLFLLGMCACVCILHSRENETEWHINFNRAQS